MIYDQITALLKKHPDTHPDIVSAMWRLTYREGEAQGRENRAMGRLILLTFGAQALIAELRRWNDTRRTLSEKVNERLTWLDNATDRTDILASNPWVSVSDAEIEYLTALIENNQELATDVINTRGVNPLMLKIKLQNRMQRMPVI